MRLGVDRGGSWLRLCLAQDGKVLRRAKLPSVPVRGQALAGALRAQLRRWGRPGLERAFVGARGVWTPAECRRLRATLAGLAGRVVVVSDADLAQRAAFAGAPGALVIAGTGGIAVARGREGLTRAGGLGPFFNDEGSGFWIGRQGVLSPDLASRWPKGLALRLAHDADPLSAIAALARRILGWAEDGDAGAARICDEAAGWLARFAVEASLAAGLSAPAPVSWHGSLFRDQGFLRRFQRAAETAGLLPVAPRLPSDVAAATLELNA